MDKIKLLLEVLTLLVMLFLLIVVIQGNKKENINNENISTIAKQLQIDIIEFN